MFLVSIAGSVLLYLTVYSDGSLEDPLDSLSLFRTKFSLTAPEPLEFLLCIFLGLLCGFLGGIFNSLVGFFIKVSQLAMMMTPTTAPRFGHHENESVRRRRRVVLRVDCFKVINIHTCL